MADLLRAAAKCVGVAFDASAGPCADGVQAWARWPRPRLQVANDILHRVMSAHGDVRMVPAGGGALWRGCAGDWTFTGSFEETVAALALHVCGREARASA